MMHKDKIRSHRVLPFCLLLLAGLLAAVAQAVPNAPPPVFREFALQVETAAATEDAAAINDRVDVDGLAALITMGYEPATRTNNRLRAQLRSQLDWGQAITGAVAAGGNYRLLRLREEHGHVRALYRLNTPEGLNYHDMLLVADDAGIWIRDIYVYASGEWLSDSLRRPYLVAVSHNDVIGPDMAPRDRLFVAHRADLARPQTRVLAGDHTKALSVYRVLPAALQQEKFVQLSRAVSAARVGGAALQTAQAEYARLFPGDIGFDLILAEAAREQGAAADADTAIDRVDRALGGDPYLNVLRGVIALRREQYQRARDLAEDAIMEESQLSEAHMLRIAAVLGARDHKGTADALTTAQDKAGLQFGSLDRQPAFADFLDSSPGKKWVEEQDRLERERKESRK